MIVEREDWGYKDKIFYCAPTSCSRETPVRLVTPIGQTSEPLAVFLTGDR
jgi:hypothetical protein